ncbi:PQQ-binding-like beta-propeller repeat protein [Streptomyces sp. ISL-94]|uniref:outer membrane protein assembly factor BamB family protein n=1 Tax=Streptomyces sp. ISL-94 TaxID=2819190 RepID=UPI001BECAF63|nr:PQQ-binding-like beta-propeller repeat protein [Streptomyces sp. ISL-94]MBT2480277.1 PQQ-binding-like beta-propeller repeat protein [Streptomyces sp. ISL-94]
MDNTPRTPHTPPLSERLFGLLRLVVTAALGAVTLLYCVLFLKMGLADMPGRWCGVDSCPRGMGWLLLFIPLLGIAAGLLWRSVRQAADLRRSCLVRVLAVVVALAALWPGWTGYEWMRGPQMDLFGWQVPTQPVSVKPVGVWNPDRSGMLVRARADGLIAFNGEGRKNWRLPAPDGTAVCALSGNTPSGIGLLAYEGDGRDGRGCGSQVAAVDLAEGRRLWHKDFTARALVAAVGTAAVVAEEGALVGLDLRGGGERWRVAIPRECRVEAVDGAGDRVLYVEQCTGGAPSRLSAVDATTGARAWQTSLPTSGPPGGVRFFSAQPIAVRVTDAVLLFDGDGQARGSVPVSGLEEDLLPEPAPVVTGGLLVAPVTAGKKAGLSAYSLTDGHRVWHAGFGKEAVRALAVGRGGEVDVVTSGPWWTYLTHVDAAKGKRREEPTILRELPLGSRFVFFPGPPGSYVFVNLDQSDALPPTFDIDPVRGW